MRTANPALSEKVFTNTTLSVSTERKMTLTGTATKTLVLLAIVVIGAAFSWYQVAANPALIGPFAIGGLIGGLVLSLVTIFKQEWSPYTAPVYALFEGLFLGALSMLMNQIYPGIVPQAVALTFGTLFCLLLAYVSRIVRATENFKLGVVAATGGIFLVYLVSFVLRLFGTSIPFILESGLIGIGFSVFVVIVAALNLVLDFDFIEQGAEQGLPHYMEWYGGFGLLVTLVWLYVEILRLLAKLRD